MTNPSYKMEFTKIIRKIKTKKILHTIKREVKPSDLKFFFKPKPRKAATSSNLKLAVKAPAFHFSFALVRSFAVVCIIFALLAQLVSMGVSAKKTSKEVLGIATSAYSDLNSASVDLKDYQFSNAENLFDQAQNNLASAKVAFNRLFALQFLPQARSATNVLNGASNLALAGQKLSQGLSVFADLKVNSNGVAGDDFNKKLRSSLENIKDSETLLATALDFFALAKNLPPEYSSLITDARSQVTQLKQIISTFVELEQIYLAIFSDDPKTYLLVFQNYDELRATGGFLGTYGILKTKAGKISALKIESVYNLDGRINDSIAAPLPMQPGVAKWRMRDANWFVDFPLSAEKLLYFFEKGSSTADGVIAVTPKLFEQMLGLVGPIQMPQYGVTLTQENFQELVQFKTSIDYDPELNQPKKLLSDFSYVLLNRLMNLNQVQWFDLFQILLNNLNQKHIMIYSKDSEAQKFISDAGFDGSIKQTNYDYLAVYNTNLSGTKSDLAIKQNFDLYSKLLSDSSVINTLTITRKNEADSKNRSFVRILVPKASKLVSSSGFTEEDFERSNIKSLVEDPDLKAWEDSLEKQGDIWVGTEANKTEFAGWATTEAGKTKKMTLVYTLPINLSSSFGTAGKYGLLIQKQPGTIETEFNASFDTRGKKIGWHTSNVYTSLGILNYTSKLVSDDFFGFVIE